MLFRPRLLFIALCGAPAAAIAQHAGATPASRTVPPEAQQYAFLIGQWDLSVKVPPVGLGQRIHGVPKLAGTWKAWPAFDGFGIEDELRITDVAGNPIGLGTTLRIYDRAIRQWSLATLDVYTARLSTSTAEWKDGMMSQSAHGTDREGKAYVSRSRFYDIKPGGFRFQQDRSYDDGKTWTEGTLAIEAKRVTTSAPR